MPAPVADPVLAPPGRHAGPTAGGPHPGDDLVEFALRVARGSTAERVSFHAAYGSAAADPGIDRVSVITELRRMVLLAEIHGTGAGAWRDGRDAADALTPYRGRLTVEVRVRFRPERGCTTLPGVEVHLNGATTMQPAIEVYVEPIQSPGAATPGSQPAIVGAVIEAAFAVPAVRGVHTLVIHVDHGALAAIDLTRMA
ncbi:MAG TPA: hypothetical protein VFD69_15040 [Vicinamibacterales bacterium]|nr:hypothetical protein [Vicinamibacterales bacterium]